ncbi:MAG TPA: hypothetical protein VEC56_03765 [Candidatus Krumholzibacteria bacterium]|nr:hypothetical protein [Candidatus Krumholzibacteria bacterium]
MPVTYSFHGSLLKIELVAQYQPDDVIKAFVAAMDDPKCPKPASLLLDVRRSETLATAAVVDIRRVAEYVGPYAARVGGRVAVVAASDVHFGLSRLGSVYTEGVGVEAQVFRDVESAVAWLGSPKK